MQTLGLDRAAEFPAYVDALRRTHERRITLTITDLAGRNPRTLEPLILDGQVTVDAAAAPTRVLTLTLLDPTASLAFEGDAGDVPVHRSRMIQVTYSVRVPALGRWVDCVCFTGPIHDFDREGPVVSLTAHGKEVQALGNRWNQRRWPAKANKAGIIRALLTDTGETRMAIPSLKATTAARLTVMRMDQPWNAAKRLAASMNRQLFYDGRGVATLRTEPTAPVHTFGPEWLLTPVKLDRDPEGIRNTWRIVGKDPKGPKKRPAAIVTLPVSHPNSASSLARNGKPLRLAVQETNNQLKTQKACRARAVALRDAAIRSAVDCSVDVLPVPFLDERDLVTITDGSGAWTVRLDRWVLPLGIDGSPGMSIGAIKRAGGYGGRRRTGPRPAGVAAGL